MDQIPLLGWILIILILLLTIAVNIGLFAMVAHRRMNRELTRRMQRPNRTAQTVKRIQEALRDPFGKERAQLSELSDLVSKLNHPVDGNPEVASGNPAAPDDAARPQPPGDST